jgi:hypothetical protein
MERRYIMKLAANLMRLGLPPSYVTGLDAMGLYGGI